MEQFQPNVDPDIKVVRNLDLDGIPEGTIRKYWLHLVTNGLGQPIYVPVMVAKGMDRGPVVGLTAAVHGNEINGLPVIQKLFHELDVGELKGVIIAVPVLNVPSFLLRQRHFIDGVDLNHIMPGKIDGNVSEVYAYRIFNLLIKKFDFLIDLHTASFGRVNSYYIRADMEDEMTSKMASLQHAPITVHNPPSDGTLRGAADELGIPAITLEIGDPNQFQKGMIRSSLTGIHNTLIYLDMIWGNIEVPEDAPVLCSSSYWLYADHGGILRVFPEVTDLISRDQPIANLQTVFGDLVKRYQAPSNGIVIGKSVNPICQTGGRILHLGIVAD